jgi:hypothetical protein
MARCPLAPLDRAEENTLCRVTCGLANVAALPAEIRARLMTLGLIDDRFGQLELSDLGRRCAGELFARRLAADISHNDNVVVLASVFAAKFSRSV